MSFKSLLASLTLEDADRSAVEAMIAKYPDLDKAVASAEDLKTEARERKAAERKAEALDQELNGPTGWKPWMANNWDADSQMTIQEKAARDAHAVLQARITEMEAGIIPGGERMAFDANDFATLKTQLAAEGYVTKTELDSMITSKTGEVTNTLNAHGQILGGFEQTWRNTAHLPLKFQRELGMELGTDFNMGRFIDFAGAKAAQAPGQPIDFEKAYEEFIAPDKQALEMKKQQAAIAKERADLDAEKAALEVKRTSAPSPTDDGTGGPQIGTLQRRMLPKERQGESSSGGQKLGNGMTALIAAEEQRKGTLVTKETVQ